MRILVCGDRYWTDEKLIKGILVELEEQKGITMLIEGEAPGVDTIARKVCEQIGNIVICPFPAEWDKYGRAAGPIRNKQMLIVGKPDLILAFHDNIDKSKGTKNMIKQAKKAGVPVRLISHVEVK